MKIVIKRQELKNESESRKEKRKRIFFLYCISPAECSSLWARWGHSTLDIKHSPWNTIHSNVKYITAKRIGEKSQNPGLKFIYHSFSRSFIYFFILFICWFVCTLRVSNSMLCALGVRFRGHRVIER